MPHQKVIKNLDSGLYFVEGSGFSGTAQSATRFECYDDADAFLSDCAAKFGVTRTAVETAPGSEVSSNIRQNSDGYSWEPVYVRRSDKVSPSPRRFATKAEAERHGARFARIEGHNTFYVKKVYEPVNAWINPETGYTNPEIGRKRLRRA